MSLLIGLAAAAAVSTLKWEGRAVVHDGARDIAIAVRSRLEEARIVSESWPVADGEAKGLRRLTIPAAGDATLERGGKVTPMLAAFATEERAQFAFYRQLQVAARRCADMPAGAAMSEAFVVDGRTSFRCRGKEVRTAANWVAAEGTPVRQEFRIVGLWHSGDAVFPRRMEIKRDGQPFFDLVVTSFSSEAAD
jgi:hypothetical protein